MNYSNSQRAGVILYLTALILGAYFTKGVKGVFTADTDTIDPKKYSAAGREEVKKYVMSKIKVCGSAGKAQK